MDLDFVTALLKQLIMAQELNRQRLPRRSAQTDDMSVLVGLAIQRY